MRGTGRFAIPMAAAVLTLTACGAGGPVNTTAGAAGGDPAGVTAGTPGGTARDAVTGRVLDTAGEPVVGIAVLPVSLDTPSRPVPELPVRTDARGRYRWPSLLPGRYELRASGPAGNASTTVTVTAGGTVTADLRLGRAG